MTDSLAARIREECRELAVANRHMSLWTSPGVSDFSCAVHSTGMSYWNSMGTAFGYSAVGEMPAPQVGRYALAGDDVRSDSVWFEAGTHSPVVVVEFERYTRPTDQGKLVGKADNLLLAHHRWNNEPHVLVLAYWTKGLASLPDHAQLRDRIKNGFVTTARERVGGVVGCEILFLQTVLMSDEQGRWRLTQIVERGI